MKQLIIITFGVLIIISYKPRKERIVIDFKPQHFKLTKMDAG